MYTDEDMNSVQDENPIEEHNVTKKSVSTVGFRNNPENQNARPLALRSTQSFTGAIEELRFCNNFQRVHLSSRSNVALVPPLAAVCPCGCLLRAAAVGPFRTREKNTLALHVVAPDVLNYHGYNFEPCQIAMFWKKDCRMFLWKGKSKKTITEAPAK
ncbi:unnamed protein product, partial [Brenthis ino]